MKCSVQQKPGDGLHISILLTVRSCIIMNCGYMYVFCMSKILFNPVALRKAKIAYNFGLSECNRVKPTETLFTIDEISASTNQAWHPLDYQASA